MSDYTPFPVWPRPSDEGGGADLSDAAAQDLGTAAAGVSTEASRADHVHDMPTAADIPVDASGFNGNLTTSDDTVQEIAQKLDDLATVATSGAYSDLSGKPTIPTQYTDENARDAIGAALVAGAGINITVNDGGDTITIESTSSVDDAQVALIAQVFGG